MATKIEFKTEADISMLNEMCKRIMLSLGFSDRNRDLIRVEPINGSPGVEGWWLVLNFPVTSSQECIIHTVMNDSRYNVYWSELDYDYM